MLMRIWMVLVLAVYPALTGWVMPVRCDLGVDTAACAVIAEPSAGCCSAKALAPAKPCCCAARVDPEPVRGCCVTAGSTGPIVLACDDDGSCRAIGVCRGPCRTLPGAPLGPTGSRDPWMHGGGGSVAGLPSYPLLVAEAVMVPRTADWRTAEVITVSERLSRLCVRTI